MTTTGVVSKPDSGSSTSTEVKTQTGGVASAPSPTPSDSGSGSGSGIVPIDDLELPSRGRERSYTIGK